MAGRRPDEEFVEPVDGLGLDGTCLRHANAHVARRGLWPGIQLEARSERRRAGRVRWEEFKKCAGYIDF